MIYTNEHEQFNRSGCGLRTIAGALILFTIAFFSCKEKQSKIAGSGTVNIPDTWTSKGTPAGNLLVKTSDGGIICFNCDTNKPIKRRLSDEFLKAMDSYPAKPGQTSEWVETGFSEYGPDTFREYHLERFIDSPKKYVRIHSYEVNRRLGDTTIYLNDLNGNNLKTFYIPKQNCEPLNRDSAIKWHISRLVELQRQRKANVDPQLNIQEDDFGWEWNVIIQYSEGKRSRGDLWGGCDCNEDQKWWFGDTRNTYPMPRPQDLRNFIRIDSSMKFRLDEFYHYLRDRSPSTPYGIDTMLIGQPAQRFWDSLHIKPKNK